jgi:hypothetical protein
MAEHRNEHPDISAVVSGPIDWRSVIPGDQHMDGEIECLFCIYEEIKQRQH